ncbi:putative acetyltransferase [Halobacillus karajensis]|uniref:Acetyltransferase YhhY n=1 Tax=Halobacillus karajensis TaxID=195088 RepID=A0A024P551_9BACI|nr:GNAT family N-acetyltransferase [Halobacillus karajensis]CDQ20526.1 putative acetyltransferase YhhY [Halobacillus karajensis]CDQ24005.1 putative acetyltransferase YhhY [Halobacillus karajensis]CDQ27483.1 putative acetyltransferase YhhY [Halobacillus karajensis]SEH90372.1 putative acetyltransferase [Halobacillus karajensis]
MRRKECIIRSGTPVDSVETIEITKEILDEGYGLKHPLEFHASLDKERNWIDSYKEPDFFLVAEVESKVVGFLNFDRGTLSSTNHQGTFGVNVKKNARGNGIGRKLVTAMIKRCKNIEDIDIIRLNVMSSNKRAISLYESFGFQIEGCFKDYIRKREGKEDLVHMALHFH